MRRKTGKTNLNSGWEPWVSGVYGGTYLRIPRTAYTKPPEPMALHPSDEEVYAALRSSGLLKMMELCYPYEFTQNN
jgi:hypothetical protein